MATKRPGWAAFRTIQGKRVSFAWFIVLEAADEDINFKLNSGRRTQPEQRDLFSQNMQLVNGVWRPKPGRPLTAKPSPFAPHIRKGRPDHALDVDSLDGGETRLQSWLERRGVDVSNPVQGETWHMEVPLTQLLTLATRLYREKQERKAKKRKQARKEARLERERKRAQQKQNKARESGANWAGIIWDACQKFNVPFALGLALVEKESAFLNQYGHDRFPGKPPIWHGKEGRVMVTEENIKDYLKFAKRTGQRQGVGPVQLTSGGFQDEAVRRGGLHRPDVTIPYGIEILAGNMKALGTMKGIGAYNGGRGNPQMDYARDVKVIWDKWTRRLK